MDGQNTGQTSVVKIVAEFPSKYSFCFSHHLSLDFKVGMAGGASRITQIVTVLLLLTSPNASAFLTCLPWPGFSRTEVLIAKLGSAFSGEIRHECLRPATQLRASAAGSHSKSTTSSSLELFKHVYSGDFHNTRQRQQVRMMGGHSIPRTVCPDIRLTLTHFPAPGAPVRQEAAHPCASSGAG